jgi:hypothetical protein
LNRHLAAWCAALMVGAAVPAAACSPPPRLEASGFFRDAVAALPKNARGVMFAPPRGGAVQARDFALTSDRDARPLAVRIRALDAYEVRLEPVQGFQPGARYTFRYLPAHGQWQFPDAMQVAIDDRVVSTKGHYALAPAPRAKRRMIVIPGGAACVQPVIAAVQDFTYTVPPALMPYAASLAYGARADRLPIEAVGVAYPVWPSGPHVYSALMGRAVTSAWYDSRNDAVVAPCSERVSRVRLSGVVRFPEVDEQVHTVRQHVLDMNRHVDGACNPLDALVGTLAERPFEPALRAVCHAQAVGAFSMEGRPLRAVTPDEWAFQLGFFYEESPTCNLVGLAHVLKSGQFSADPVALGIFGSALKEGLRGAQPEQWDAAVHALDYLVGQLPPATQAATARRLLAPARPLLVEALAGKRPQRPKELARLIAWGSEPVRSRTPSESGAK